MKQIEMLSLNDLVSLNHRYRQYSELWDFEKTYKQEKATTWQLGDQSSFYGTIIDRLVAI